MFPNNKGPVRGPRASYIRAPPAKVHNHGKTLRNDFGGPRVAAALSPSLSTLGYLAEPIDYQLFSSGQAAIAFKSLAKKDETTRARGLEELIALADAAPFDTTGGVEEAVLQAWSSWYPRVSIDESRRVRELAHACQLSMMKSGRKRMERLIPVVVGPWLAGTFDRDTQAAKAARDGLATFLSTEQKTVQFYKKLQSQILDFALAALNETPATLCDLRSVKRDVALLKHARVQYSCFGLVLKLFRTLSVADTEPLADKYTAFFASDAVGSSMLSPDHVLRRINYDLLAECLATRPQFVTPQLPAIEERIIDKAQTIGQYGSIVSLLKLLQKMAETSPDVWTSDAVHPYVQLKPLLEKGSQNTPASPSSDVWAEINQLFSVLPARDIESEEASGVLTSFQRGLADRREPRENAVGGWTAYLSMANRLIGCITPEEARQSLFEAHVLPIFGHYLAPPSASLWDSSAHVPIVSNAVFLVSRSAYPDIVASARSEWTKLASDLADRVANSLPEVSPKYAASQKAVADEGERWFALVAAVHQSAKKNPAGSSATNLAEDVLEQPSLAVLQKAVDVLQRRDYKPFGAAELLLSAITHVPHLLASDSGKAIMTSLLPADDREQLALMLSSPSASTVLSCLRAVADIPALREHYQTAYGAIVSTLLANASEANAGETAKSLVSLLSHASDAVHATNRRNADLQQYLADACLAAAEGTTTSDSSWDLFKAVFAVNELSLATVRDLTRKIVDAITIEATDKALDLLTALEIIASHVPRCVAGDESMQLHLMSKLLALMELDGDDKALSAKVLALRQILDNNSKHSKNSKHSSSRSRSSSSSSISSGAAASASNLSALLTIVQSNIDHTGPDSLEVSTLVEQVQSIVEHEAMVAEDKKNLFPDTAVWMADLKALLQDGVNLSLSLTSALRGAYLLVPSQSSTSTHSSVPVPRDRHDTCRAARMAAYTVSILSIPGLSLQSLPQTLQVQLLYALYLVAGIGADQVALDAHDSLWGDLSASLASTNSGWALLTAEEQLDNIQALLASEVAALSEETTQAMIEMMLQKTRKRTPLALYTARALSQVVQTRSSAPSGGGVPSEAALSKLDLWKVGSPETALGAVALLVGYGELLGQSKTINTFVNRLVSEVSGLSLAADKREKTATALVVLNAALNVYGVGQVPAAKNRLVFAVKHLTSWFAAETETTSAASSTEGAAPNRMDTRIMAESCWALSRMMPCIKDIYGPHWERTIRFCINLWRSASAAAPESDEPLPYLHASLKLVSIIKAMSEGNGNDNGNDDDDGEAASDDLGDAMTLFGDALWAGARQLLLSRAHFPAAILARPQPHQIVDDALSRMAQQTPFGGRLLKTAPYFGMVSSDSRSIQAAGFNVLHRAIPAEQSELSLKTILDKQVARLPDELMALVADAPTLEAYPDDVLSTFPTPLRTYLLGWKLIYDAFSTASAKVRGHYADQLAEARVVPGLLEFTFDVLGHSAGDPLKLDREGLAAPADIVDYELSVTGEADADAEADEHHLHRLLVHVCYLTLLYAQGLFKTWFVTCRSKQTTNAIDAWTRKYLSPMLIDAALDVVEQWADEQQQQQQQAGGSSGDDDHEMTVTVRHKARQVVASYEMDDTTMSVTLQLPSNYPLGKVACLGTNRMLVSEQKWETWMMITEGVIALSSSGGSSSSSSFGNGSLIDGLTAFRRNVTSTLKGQTECAICYCFISEDKKMPETRCSTCKHLFHKLCLYKWLSTSSQNTCPLCRNQIGLHQGSKVRRNETDDPFLN